MPFCTECGARHSDDARVCPKCGTPIFQSPSDDLGDVLESLDLPPAGADELPDLGDWPEPTETPSTVAGDYGAQIVAIRDRIAAQTAALESIEHLAWSNPAAVAIREQFAGAIEQLRQIAPPAELASVHQDFVEGAELIAGAVSALVEASERGSRPETLAAVETSIAQATQRFLGAADQLGRHFVISSRANPVDTADQDLDLSAIDDLDALLDSDDLPPEPPDDLPALTPAASTRSEGLVEPLDLDELDDEIDQTLTNLEPPPEVPQEGDGTELDVAPELAFDLSDLPSELADLAEPARGSAAALPPPSVGVPAIHASGDRWRTGARESGDAGAQESWGGIGDPTTDSLLLEIESGWVRGRPPVHDALERAIRGAVVDALRAAYATRVRIEQEARASLARVAAERNRLNDEVEVLRRDAHGLQAEVADLRRTVTELERERQAVLERRQQMFQDADAHRSQLLREIEHLSGQLDTMRRNIVNLLNLSAGAGEPDLDWSVAASRPVDAPRDATSARSSATDRGDRAAPVLADDPAAATVPGSSVMAARVPQSVGQSPPPLGQESVPDAPAAATRPVPRPPAAPPRAARPEPPPIPEPNLDDALLDLDLPADGPSSTEVRIAGVASLARNMQIQRAIKSIPGVAIEGQPKFRNGILSATVSHGPTIDLVEALTAIAGVPLTLENAEPGVIELKA